MLLTRNFPELWKFGSQERADRGTPIALWGFATNNAVAARYSTLRQQGTQVGYQVPAGKTLLITQARYHVTAAGTGFLLGYSDADLGISAAADGANPVFFDNTNTSNSYGAFLSTVAATIYELAVYYEIPAGKYPRIATPGGATWSARLQTFGVLV